jgi:hypothetical protein
MPRKMASRIATPYKAHAALKRPENEQEEE